MAVDPQMQAILDARAALPPIHSLSVPEARAQFKLPRPRGLRIAEVASVSNRSIPGPGGPLRLRVYAPNGSGPFPLLVFFHGGGFVVCDLDTHDPTCRNLCAGAGCVVASVDYRLAPEHRFPAAPDDCLAAARWCAANAAALGADPARGVAVAGDSAGGNLAAVTAIRARDEGGPRLAGQLLVYPGTDWAMAPRPSLAEYGEGYWLTAREVAWFRDHYLGGPAEHRHPHASPLHAADLRGLPPALVITAEYDPLRDEGEAYAARLREAGVPTTVSRYEGVIHGFFSLRGLVGRSDAAQAEACTWLRGAFMGRT